MDCLYKTLGVRKSARPETIKRAFRKRAADTHPDKNPGQAEKATEFQAVMLAWRILSDPERKHRYDETGDVSDVPTNRPFIGVLSDAFQAVVSEMIRGGQYPEKVDLVAALKRWIEAKDEEVAKQETGLQEAAAKLQRLEGRFKDKKGESLLAQIAAGQRMEILKQIGQCQQLRVLAKEALDYLAHCSFTVDAAKQWHATSAFPAASFIIRSS